MAGEKTFLPPACRRLPLLLRGKGRSKLAVRVPDHAGARALCRQLNTLLWFRLPATAPASARQDRAGSAAAFWPGVNDRGRAHRRRPRAQPDYRLGEWPPFALML